MTLQFMATLIGLLNDRQRLQRMVWKLYGYSPQNKYNQCCWQLEGLLEDVLELIDDHEYRSVLDVPYQEWGFLKKEK
jgi:hypothetical protein